MFTSEDLPLNTVVVHRNANYVFNVNLTVKVF